MRISRLLLSAILLAYAASAAAQPVAAKVRLQPFSTDGCSLWIDGTARQPFLWRHCCVAHDKDYWLGGSMAERQRSDETLQACVTQAGGKAMGDYLYLSVRFGGAPLWLMPYRWGYGWDYWDNGKPRGYKRLTALEQEEVARQLPATQAVLAEDARKHPASAER